MSPPPSLNRNSSYEMQNHINNGMYPPSNRDYNQDPGPSTYHENHNQAYNPYPLPGASFNPDPMMQHQTDLQQTSSYPNYLQPSRSTQAPNVLGPSPDSVITASTPRSGQNNLDLSGYLDPTDKVEPKMPFFHNNPSVVKGHPATDDDNAAGRNSDGEDPGELLERLPMSWANVSLAFDAERRRSACSCPIVCVGTVLVADVQIS
jgi:hypothetical protein